MGEAVRTAHTYLQKENIIFSKQLLLKRQIICIALITHQIPLAASDLEEPEGLADTF